MTYNEAQLRALMRADRARQNQRRDRQELLDLEATERTGSAAMIESMQDRYTSRP